MVIAWKNIGHDTHTGLSISVSNFKCFVAKARYILNHRLALHKQVLFTEIYLSKKKFLHLGIVYYSRWRRRISDFCPAVFTCRSFVFGDTGQQLYPRKQEPVSHLNR